MKRGFLLKAAEKKRSSSDKRDDAQVQPSKPKDTLVTLQDISSLVLPKSREDLPSNCRLPFGKLTEQERGEALPEDYDKNNASLIAEATLFKTIPHIQDGDGSTEWVIKDPRAEKKVMNTPGYPARKPKPSRPGLYEVRATEKMGQGVFAKHNIKCGDIIFSERPLLVAPNWLAKSKADMNEKYTFEQSRQIMMFEHEKVLEVAFQRMSEKDKALYMALCNSHTTDGTGPLMGIMRTNGFGANELSDDGNSLLNYSGLCNLGSRLNHSCRPNVIFSFKVSSFSFQFIAAQDIKVGEELYCAYTNLARTKVERQTDLAPYGFTCNCLACVNASLASDVLRKTFKDEVSRLDAQRKQPGLMADTMASAKALESKLVAEGLDVTFDFLTLLCLIFLCCDKLGRWVEKERYKQRTQKYSKIHIHDTPMLQHFLAM